MGGTGKVASATDQKALMCPSPEHTDSASAAPALTYTVSDMSCGHCKAAVTEAVTEVAGVESVDVDLDTRLVVVNGTSVADDAVRAAVADAGYEASRS